MQPINEKPYQEAHCSYESSIDKIPEAAGNILSPFSRRTFMSGISELLIGSSLSSLSTPISPAQGEDQKIVSSFEASGVVVKPLQYHKIISTHEVQWAPDGKRAITVDQNIIKTWDVATGNELLRYESHNDEVLIARWSHDGQWIASAGFDCRVYVWNAITGETITIYQGHSNWVRCLAWKSDDAWIASAGYDQTLQVWHAYSGKRLVICHAHENDIWSLTWSPDSQYIASVDLDNVVRIWHIA